MWIPAQLTHDECALLRQGLPDTQETVCLFLTVGNFLVNEITMSYFLNSTEFKKIGSTEASLVFSWFERKTVESQGLQIIILRGVCIYVRLPVFPSVVKAISLKTDTLKNGPFLLNPIFLKLIPCVKENWYFILPANTTNHFILR